MNSAFLRRGRQRSALKHFRQFRALNVEQQTAAFLLYVQRMRFLNWIMVGLMAPAAFIATLIGPLLGLQDLGPLGQPILTGSAVACAIGAIMLLFNPLVALVFRRKIRALLQEVGNQGHRACAVCGYDLRGSPGDTCPECGAQRARGVDA